MGRNVLILLRLKDTTPRRSQNEVSPCCFRLRLQPLLDPKFLMLVSGLIYMLGCVVDASCSPRRRDDTIRLLFRELAMELRHSVVKAA